MVQCVTCGGTYEPMLPDGTQYFHACPPLAGHEIRAGLDNGTVTLSRADAARLQAAQDADRDDPPAGDDESHVDAFVRTLTIERPEKRDENVRPGADDKKPADRIKAPGRGVVDVPRDALTGGDDPRPPRSIAR